MTGRHRAPVRPRYGRMATLGSSVAVVLIAVLGGTGALPSAADAQRGADPGAALIDRGTQADTGDDTGGDTDPAAGNTGKNSDNNAGTNAGEKAVDDTGEVPATKSDGGAEAPDTGLVPIDPSSVAPIDTTLPGDSGTGKRVVYSESRQRVWLVTEDEKVVRTYLVSGSIYDNLDPGTFEVYSRSENAVGIDNSGTMRHFVRFTQGTEGAAIGFHDIPIADGLPVQTFKQLGTPLSHGCIRQKPKDAVALWEFAPIGTTVVVTA